MKQIFKELGLTRYCCKMCISTSVDLSDKMIQYNSITENVKQIGACVGLIVLAIK